MHDSWNDCQKACVAIKECWFWTYYTEDVTDKSKFKSSVFSSVALQTTGSSVST